jgi:hypothetical protein
MINSKRRYRCESNVARRVGERNIPRARSIGWLLSYCLIAVFSGCSHDGPELGEVHGQVTLGGKPVPFAYVNFQPIDPPGTYGAAYTDTDGNYRLQFTRDRVGAPVGKHQVSIRTSHLDELQVEDKSTGLMVTPALPDGYRAGVEATFERTVVPGENLVDFELPSKVP